MKEVEKYTKLGDLIMKNLEAVAKEQGIKIDELKKKYEKKK